MTIKKEAGRTGFSIRRRVFDKIEVRTLTWRRGHQVAVNDASPDHFITTNEKDCQGPETWWRGHQIAFRRTLTFYNEQKIVRVLNLAEGAPDCLSA